MAMSKLKVMEILARIPVFKGLTPSERDFVMKMPSNFVPVRAETAFIKEGSHEPFFYIVLSGKANVMHKGHAIGSLEAGQFIGEVGFICKEPRSATVISETDMVMMKIDSEAFRHLPVRIREIIKDKIIAGLVSRVTKMNDNVIKYEDKIEGLEKRIKTLDEDPRNLRKFTGRKAKPEAGGG